ncbi:LPS-assembly protein LptD [Hahella aquimaris]|uniref:LPS-assembly protein LptD n=1 Tax=Hahella sp. HNIBRBA332 TaxID=3015983 RepID=UPI00273C8BD2|nr:LPS-assembly protein LptD [Hahella sp. HNIBRBA332]WLQ13897.1 LPS-assembly protein LptD [Hahella sp. HNIBRBA332]
MKEGRKRLRAGYCYMLAGVVGVASTGSSHADSAPQSAAMLDWRMREFLTPQQMMTLEPQCRGTYVEPEYGFVNAPSTPSTSDNEALRARSDTLISPSESAMRLQGNVKAQQGAWWLEADQVELDRQTNVVDLQGLKAARAPGLLLHGETARYNLDSKDFSLSDASYLIHQRHARGDAERISSADAQLVRIEDGSYTTCDPMHNDWSIAASEIILDREQGEGTAKHMTLRVKDVPVMYFPYLRFPIDDRRKSGFLYPTIGTSNTGRGMSFGIPYYFNLAPDYDATYSPLYMHGRGLLSELEGRWLTEDTYSEMRLGYIAHDSEFSKENPNESGRRWALDFTNRYDVSKNWRSTIDYNVVSDKDYLNDLNRTLEIQQETHIKRSWDVAYLGGGYSFKSHVQGYQTVDDDIVDNDRPYMLLPQLSFGWGRDFDPVAFGLESEFTYFWRDDENLDPARDQQVVGARWRTQPSLKLPLSTTWGYLTPKLRLDHTDYQLEQRATGLDESISRTVPFYSLDAGMYFDRTLTLFGDEYNQSLEPRLFYVYSPEQDQDDIPDFDTSVATFSYSQLYKEDRFVGGDRVGDNNRLTLGVTSRFNDRATGAERLRASVGQIFYYEDQQVGLGTEGLSDESESPWAGELVWRPNDRFDFKVEGLWDWQERQTEKGATTLAFHDPEYRKLLNLSHRYTHNDLEQTDVSVLFPVTDSVSVLGRWFFDLVNHRTIGTMAGVEYNDCCWRFQVIARSFLKDADDTENSELDHGVFLRFQLRGLGNIGSRFEDVMAKEMRNFNERETYRTERYQW